MKHLRGKAARQRHVNALHGQRLKYTEDLSKHRRLVKRVWERLIEAADSSRKAELAQAVDDVLDDIQATFPDTFENGE
jgi:hypothetical protein